MGGSGLVVFLSDFGLRDPYVGIVHGVIESVGGGKVKVIDLGHDLPPFNIESGAYSLYVSYKYFPRGTVFLVVVDPGVGSGRRAVALKTRNYFFVGPDNGVLWPAASSDGLLEARSIENESLMLKPVSRSFHGRDIFAPVATFLALGGRFDAIGPLVDVEDLVKLELIESCGFGSRRIVYVDRFGNAALSLRGRECFETLCGEEGALRVCSADRCWRARCVEVFSLAEPGELVLYVNSFGFLELSVFLGSAAERLGLKPGSRVVIEKD